MDISIIATGTILVVIAVAIAIWYFVFKKNQNLSNLVFTEPIQEVELLNNSLPRPKIVSLKGESLITTPEKVLKPQKTYIMTETYPFSIFIEFQKVSIQLANRLKEIVSTVTFADQIIVDNTEYNNMTQKGDKFVVVAISDDWLYINTRPIKQLDDEVRSFNIIGDTSVKSIRFKRGDSSIKVEESVKKVE